MKIGIDIGGVLTGAATQEDTTFFSDRYLETPEIEGAFGAVSRLVNLFGPDSVFLVSKAAPSTQLKTLEWLDHHLFHEVTLALRRNVRFCLKRPDKAVIARELGLHAFVDDKCEVLSYLRGVVAVRVAFRSRDAKQWTDPGICHADSWPDVVTRLRTASVGWNSDRGER
jgi:hypothetical protein